MFEKNIKAIKTAATGIYYTSYFIAGIIAGSLVNCILWGWLWLK